MDIHRDFEARVRLLTTEEGGRHSPLLSGYRGQLYFEGMDYGLISWEFKVPALAYPGDTIDLFIVNGSEECREYLRSHMSVGSKFAIREGRRTVAVGEITAMFPDD
jgi:elongation factor Tu